MTDDEIQRGFADALDRDDARVVLAEMDSIVAGYAVFVKVVTPERPGVRASRTGLIDELCVSPDFRRRGVGRALMEEVKRLCAELTLDRLELTVWTFNESALAFYRDCGFDDVMHRLSMPI